MKRSGNASRSRRRRAAVVSALLATSDVAACSSESGPPTLAWYINPDNGGQKEIAARCTEAAGGKYKIETSLLPNDASAQREQLLRRLAAKDSSIALMSLDPVFVAEFSQAGFLAPIPAADAKAFTDGVVKGAVAGGTWNDKLVAIPFWANTQLLWYRKSVAAKAGLDPAKTPVTWDQIVKAAKDTKTTIAVQGKRYEGYVVWINALIDERRRPDRRGVGQDRRRRQARPRDAGRRGAAAKVINEVANSGTVGPSLSTADEEAARALFQGKHRRLHGQLAVRVGRRGERREGRQPGAVGRRRLRLGAVPRDGAPARTASRRSAGSSSASAPTRRMPTSPSTPPSASRRSRT